MMMPEEIKKDGNQGLIIKWADQQTSRLSSKLLRQNCPSADSRAKRGDLSHDQPLTPKKSLLKVVEHDLETQISLEEISMIGNYAIKIRWADGHDTGIYTFDYLYQLSKQC